MQFAAVMLHDERDLFTILNGNVKTGALQDGPEKYKLKAWLSK
jgi:hypothetical protein